MIDIFIKYASIMLKLKITKIHLNSKIEFGREISSKNCGELLKNVS